MLEKTDKKPKTRSAYLAVGLVLVFLGTGYLLGTLIHQTWIYFGTLTVCGIVMLAYGFTLNSDGFKIAGTLVFGIGIGALILFNEKIEASTEVLIGSGLLIFTIFWMILAIILGATKNIARLWPLIPAGIILPFSIIFLFEKTSFLFFVLAGGVSSGCTLLGWGLIRKWFGLVIPGSILASTGPGVFFAWRPEAVSNGLVQTGVMLVWFAFGWGIIALLSRYLFSKVIWWPLIPGGVLAFVGWGLLLGGNGNKAFGYIGNSGSIIVILIGLYLLLLRKDIHK